MDVNSILMQMSRTSLEKDAILIQMLLYNNQTVWLFKRVLINDIDLIHNQDNYI